MLISQDRQAAVEGGDFRASAGGKSSEVRVGHLVMSCLLYTSDAADERSSVDLGGRRIIKKNKTKQKKKKKNKNKKKK